MMIMMITTAMRFVCPRRDARDVRGEQHRAPFPKGLFPTSRQTRTCWCTGTRTHPFAGAAYPEFVRASHVLLLPPRVRPFYDYFRPRYINLHYYIIHYSKYDIILVQPRWDGMLPLPHMSQITACLPQSLQPTHRSPQPTLAPWRMPYKNNVDVPTLCNARTWRVT